MERDTEVTVRALLTAEGIAPSDEEILGMTKAYPQLRALADSLYTPEASKYLPAFAPVDADLEER